MSNVYSKFLQKNRLSCVLESRSQKNCFTRKKFTTFLQLCAEEFTRVCYTVIRWAGKRLPKGATTPCTASSSPRDLHETCRDSRKRYPRFADHFFPGALLFAGRFPLFGKSRLTPSSTAGRPFRLLRRHRLGGAKEKRRLRARNCRWKRQFLSSACAHSAPR